MGRTPKENTMKEVICFFIVVFVVAYIIISNFQD
nr:MAG TPA: hypothetical protein [Caudoviricetes sp.]